MTDKPSKEERRIAARREVLRNLDLKAARRLSGVEKGMISDSIMLMAIHQERYEDTGLETQLRHESAEYLRQNGFKRQMGGKLLPPGELP